jgi:hypothetical protein
METGKIIRETNRIELAEDFDYGLLGYNTA